MYKFGKVSIVGRPNVGKSTLLNKLVGEKISIVSPKAQTTRDLINGCITTDEYQIIFVDTPGINKGGSPLSKYMEKGIKAASTDVDVILYCVDGEKPLYDGVIKEIESYKNITENLVVVLTKLDRANKEKLVSYVERIGQIGANTIIPISTFIDKNIDELIKIVVDLLPEGEKMYDDDFLTDKPMRFIVAERIREKILYRYNEEIPHGIAVTIQTFDFDEKAQCYHIYADIICEKQAHKGILIGKNGEALKEVGERTRIDLERFLDAKVYLELFVKVKENWRESEFLTKEFGFDPKDYEEL